MFFEYLLQDLPIIITTLICMWVVFSMAIEIKSTKRKIWALVSIEVFEHIVLPFLLIITLLTLPAIYTVFAFHIFVLSFCFGWLGWVAKVTLRRRIIIALFAYFFLFAYPLLVIWIQQVTSIKGWTFILATNFLFLAVYILRNRLNPRKGSQQ